jgi:hypothetical protein
VGYQHIGFDSDVVASLCGSFARTATLHIRSRHLPYRHITAFEQPTRRHDAEALFRPGMPISQNP